MKFEDYEHLAKLLGEARKIMFTHERQKGKAKPINTHFDKALKSVDTARSQLESMMFIEYPKQASIYIFYPSTDERLNKPKTASE